MHNFIANQIVAPKRPSLTKRTARWSESKPPKYMYVEKHLNVVVEANTCGEARALMKKKLGIKKKGRLPVGTEINRFPNPARPTEPSAG